MIKQILLILTITLASCGSSKNVTQKNNSTKRYTVDKRTTNKTVSSNSNIKQVSNKIENNNVPSIAEKVIWTAVTYKGTPYKYGGTTKKGMDCSGLVYTSFMQRGVQIPRTSSLMYVKGSPITLTQAGKGDLLFFHTSGKTSKSSVNHVGLVTSNVKGDIKFIHATSSRGVVVSSISEPYWNSNFIGVKRVIE